MNQDNLKSLADIAGILQIVVVLGVFPAISALRSIAKSVRDVDQSIYEFKLHVHENFLTKEDYLNFNSNRPASIKRNRNV